ncbi:MAG: hypothetical protein WDW38_007248 [Sanguina aurantia]
MERLDEQIVPAVSKAISASFGARPEQIGWITFSRAAVQAIASPLGGFLGHQYDRVVVLACGCMFWAFFTCAFAFISGTTQGAMVWAFNGIGLSLIIPNTQSLIADYYPDHSRGSAFGVLQFTGAMGGMLGSVYATNLGCRVIFGYMGWRFVFVTVAALSMMFGLLVFGVARDPRYNISLANHASTIYHSGNLYHPLPGKDSPQPPRTSEDKPRLKPSSSETQLNTNRSASPTATTLPGTATATNTNTNTNTGSNMVTGGNTGNCVRSRTSANATAGGGGGGSGSSSGVRDGGGSSSSRMFNRRGSSNTADVRSSAEGSPASVSAQNSGSQLPGNKNNNNNNNNNNNSWTFSLGWHPSVSPLSAQAVTEQLVLQQQQTPPLLPHHITTLSAGSWVSSGRNSSERGASPLSTDTTALPHRSASGTAASDTFTTLAASSGSHGRSQCNAGQQLVTGPGQVSQQCGSAPEPSLSLESTFLLNSAGDTTMPGVGLSGPNGGGGGGVAAARQGAAAGAAKRTGCSDDGVGWGEGQRKHSAQAAAAPPVLHPRRKLDMARLWRVLSIPTFRIIVLQGIVGSLPWNSLVYFTWYMQLLGMRDWVASGLMSVLLAGTAVGGLLGGRLGDQVALRYPRHGRIALVQFSVGVGVPLTFLLFKGMPLSDSAPVVAMYAVLLFTKGLLTSWAAPACNNPVFAEIVPADMRNIVYAFDRSFEGALSALGAPLVGYAAEHWFGFVKSDGESDCRPGGSSAPVANLDQAAALGNAMLLFLVVPWTLCVIIYSGLHWTYPRDKEAALTPVPASSLHRGPSSSSLC